MRGALTPEQERLESLRAAIEAENISYGELAELQDLKAHIDPGDVLLLQWAGVPEFTRTIYVVSFSPTGEMSAIGGFDWVPAENALWALHRYMEGVAAQTTDNAGVKMRLLRMEVDAELDGEDLTRFLDSDIDELEVHHPALLENTTHDRVTA